MRFRSFLAIGVLAATGAVAAASAIGADATPAEVASSAGAVPDAEMTSGATATARIAGQAELVRAHDTARRLRAQLRRERARHARALARMRRAAFARPSVRQALDLGSAAFGVSGARLRSVAMCESRLDPASRNGQYLGLFQFGSRLWNATPFRAFDRSDPYAASFAAAWALSRGMSRHWPVCGI
jgi:hypothetical protein